MVCSRCRRVKDNIPVDKKMCDDCRESMQKTRETTIKTTPKAKMYKDYLQDETKKGARKWLQDRK